MTKIEQATVLELSCLRADAQAAWDPLPLLRAAMESVRVQRAARPLADEDYKDSIAGSSAALADLLAGWVWQARTSAERREYRRLLAEAGRRGLLSGYDCPRSTMEAWAATVAE